MLDITNLTWLAMSKLLNATAVFHCRYAKNVLGVSQDSYCHSINEDDNLIQIHLDLGAKIHAKTIRERMKFFYLYIYIISLYTPQ